MQIGFAGGKGGGAIPPIMRSVSGQRFMGALRFRTRSAGKVAEKFDRLPLRYFRIGAGKKENVCRGVFVGVVVASVWSLFTSRRVNCCSQLCAGCGTIEILSFESENCYSGRVCQSTPIYTKIYRSNITISRI